jgi:hypothetical protein
MLCRLGLESELLNRFCVEVCKFLVRKRGFTERL